MKSNTITQEKLENIRKQRNIRLLLHHGGDIIIEKNW